jgi:ribosome-binding protein aMBF1 (putative translation factor)
MAEKISSQLRKAIDASGMSRYAIAKAIELDQSVMSRFMAGKSGLAVETIDKLCDLLGLELVPKDKSATRKEVRPGKRN